MTPERLAEIERTYTWHDRPGPLIKMVGELLRELRRTTNQSAPCPDPYCVGWKDSGVCPNGLNHSMAAAMALKEEDE